MLNDRHDARCCILDIGDALRWRNSKTVCMIQTVLLHLFLQLCPILRRRNIHAFEQFLHSVGFRAEIILYIACEVCPLRVFRTVKILERNAAFLGNLHALLNGVVIHHHKEHTGKISSFITFVSDFVFRQVAVQVHRA
ncbi:hypothetical protein D3C78_1227740 [compost metagenome]